MSRLPLNPWYSDLDKHLFRITPKDASVEIRCKKHWSIHWYIALHIAVIVSLILIWMNSSINFGLYCYTIITILLIVLGLFFWIDHVTRQKSPHRQVRSTIEIPINPSSESQISTEGKVFIDKEIIPDSSIRDVVVICPFYYKYSPPVQLDETVIAENQWGSAEFKNNEPRFCPTIIMDNAAYELCETRNLEKARSTAFTLKRGLGLEGPVQGIKYKSFSTRNRLIGSLIHISVQSTILTGCVVSFGKIWGKLHLSNTNPYIVTWHFFLMYAVFLAFHHITMAIISSLYRKNAVDTAQQLLFKIKNPD